MAINDSLADQRSAIAEALSFLDIGAVYTGQVDDPVPPCMVIHDPTLNIAQGTLMMADWIIILFGVRVDQRATSVAFDEHVPAILRALLKIKTCQLLSSERQEPQASGFTLPVSLIRVQFPFSLC